MQAKHQRCGKYKREKLLIPSDQCAKEKLGEKNKRGNRTDNILSCKEEHLQAQTEVWKNNFIKREMNLLREQALLPRGKKNKTKTTIYLGRSWVLPHSPQPNQNHIMFMTLIMKGYEFGEIQPLLLCPFVNTTIAAVTFTLADFLLAILSSNTT